ncbi:hypothetical protein E3Q10_03136 [Wallemia mellicola]|uniref:Methyltransferase-domain-containing protein n=1 Tax=Wallemia mellicola TaxID=1708541 RepID=A0A4T0QUB1_9BASI|nr:hypothetical protein E3Q14_02599 [Wallemia mellicola]TIC28525.1 hypothetical protein E3Q10_03136 [Wallemia mellicola]
MLYYLSFLRLPNKSVNLSHKLIFSVQITNDLRTEYYDNQTGLTIDAALLIQNRPSKPIKLPSILTYKSNKDSYKLIEIEGLSSMGIRPGDKVSLLVWARGSSTRPLLSDLKAHSPDCKTPIPVTSLPITMATNVPHSDKHSRIQRSFMFEKSLIHILEDTSYDLDKVGANCWRWQLVNMFQKLWDSGLAMSAILTEKISSEKYNFFGGSSKPLRIMELGTGTGILSITLAALLEKTPHKHTIVATDLAPALPLLKQNVDRNSRLFNKNDVFVRELAWGSQSPLEKEHFDVIIAADVAYNTSSFPMLLSTLDTLFQVNSSAKFILGYKYRDYGEADFWELLKNINLNARLIESTMGEQGSATEIWEFTKE